MRLLESVLILWNWLILCHIVYREFVINFSKLYIYDVTCEKLFRHGLYRKWFFLNFGGYEKLLIGGFVSDTWFCIGSGFFLNFGGMKNC